jgi:hypothetical protein
MGGDWQVMGYAQNNNPMTLPELPICQAFPAANQIADSVLEMLLNMVKIEGHDRPNADAVLDIVTGTLNREDMSPGHN